MKPFIRFVAPILICTPAMAFNCYDIPLPDNIRLSDLEECSIQNGLATIVDENERYGFINAKGNIVIKPAFDSAWEFQNGLALVELNGKWGYIRPDGSYVVKPTYDEAWGFSNGLAKVQKNSKVGFINEKGKVVIPIKYTDSYHWFDDGLTALSKNDKWAIVDTRGKFLTPFVYDYATSPSEGRILIGKAQRDGSLLYGFLDMKGKVVIEPQYNEAEEFSHGTSWVSKGSEEDGYYINKKGDIVDLKINLAGL